MTLREHTDGREGLRRGFSLVEVSLAIFVVSIGLLTLFTLFPKGLKQGEAGHADTQTALFADYVLSTLRANASSISSAGWAALQFNNIWPSPDPFSLDEGQGPQSVEFPEDSGLYVRYILEMGQDGLRYTIALWVHSGKYGTSDVDAFKASSKSYYTELLYSPMP